ncbi:replication-relaxation family protein [Actinoplanes sp. Pm04-4]|uniref:Replication-relaxation family protein n=1 Tax=Paractinoplanes pyxinae TaxID=2997416 RepID=A0ABT4BBX1_9ACTN|nr:replication-relaxation family protein [Actinoplanes pyxinae]MCY1144024.1 replication-relaxation family protein [Actinoplanes pyxinae]
MSSPPGPPPGATPGEQPSPGGQASTPAGLRQQAAPGAARAPRNIPAGDVSPQGAPDRRRRTAARPARAAADDLLGISWRLEPRDYVIAHLLDEHRFLTTEQITAILFTSARTCRNRLDVLRRIGFIDWFMPVHPARGRLPVHWIPGRLSARYVALHHGRPAPSARMWRQARDTSPAQATSTGHLAHADGVNQFFVDLLAHSRAHPHTRLTRWWSAARTFATINHNTRPDAHGVWRDGARQAAFFLEHDTGTESHPVRAAKLAGYRTLGDKGLSWPVLFWLPSITVETHLHQHLERHTGGHGVTVATAARDYAATHGGPAGPVWRMPGDTHRLPLAALPGPTGPGGLAYHPGPPAAEEDPLYLLRGTPDQRA